MHPKQVGLLAERMREQSSGLPDNAKLNTHLEDAHAKLIELQAVRRHMKAKLGRCIEERDDALREVERLREELRKHETPDAS